MRYVAELGQGLYALACDLDPRRIAGPKGPDWARRPLAEGAKFVVGSDPFYRGCLFLVPSQGGRPLSLNKSGRRAGLAKAIAEKLVAVEARTVAEVAAVAGCSCRELLGQLVVNGSLSLADVRSAGCEINAEIEGASN